jgi:hypothetical protein
MKCLQLPFVERHRGFPFFIFAARSMGGHKAPSPSRK